MALSDGVAASMRALGRRVWRWFARRSRWKRVELPRVSSEDRERASRLFLPSGLIDTADAARNFSSSRELIERCLNSEEFRTHVSRFITHGRCSVFSRKGRPDRDDVLWLSSVVPLPAAALDQLGRAADWRAFYAALLRLPGFALAREAIGEEAFGPLLTALGPPASVRWPDGWRTQPGPHIGNFDAIERGLARGWLWNPEHPNQPARVEFVVDGQVVHSAQASYLRSDVRASGRGSGFAGFESQLPPHLIGSELAIGARLAGSSRELADSPKRLEMPPGLRRWQTRRARASGHLLRWLRRRLDHATDGAELLFVLPVSPGASVDALRRTLAGVSAQWCSRWRLTCLLDDSAPTEILSVVREAGATDARVNFLVSGRDVDLLTRSYATWPAWKETTLVPLSCGDDLEPDAAHRFLRAALTGADIVYADEIATLDALIDATLPFRRSPHAAELQIADPASTNLLGYAVRFVRTIVTDQQGISSLSDSDFAATAAERASFIVHVPGLFRWRAGVDDHGMPCMSQLAHRPLNVGIADTGSRMCFAFDGEPARQIVLTTAGLVPTSAVIDEYHGGSADGQADYSGYVKCREKRLRLESIEIAAHITILQQTIGFVARIEGDDEDALSATVESLRSGRYPNWALWTAESRNDEFPARTYLLWIHAGEVLHDHALYWFAARAAAAPDADVIYADQDELRPDGTRCRPSFKPDWSPDLLESCDYVASAAIFRLPPIRSLLSTCHTRYDLLLRLTQADPTPVEHVRDVALHGPASADGEVAPSSQAAEVETPTDRLPCSGPHPIDVASTPEDRAYTTTLRHKAGPSVSAVLALASRDRRIEDIGRYATASAEVIDALRALPGLDLAIVVDALNIDRPAILSGRHPGVRVIEYCRDLPSLAVMINQGAAAVSAELLLILDGPYRLGAAGVLDPLVDQFAKPAVGAAGARLLQQDGRRSLGGVTIDAGYPVMRRSEEAEHHVTRNVVAATAPLMTTRALFDSVGGYSDGMSSACCHVDYCFKLRRSGKRIVSVPRSRFVDWQPGPSDCQPDIAALRELAERWPSFLMTDPYRS